MQKQIDELLCQVISEATAVGITPAATILPQVRINNRAKKRFGCCKRKATGQGEIFEIEISGQVSKAPAAVIKQILAHEVLHTCKGCYNHSATWKGLAQRMNQAYGYQITRVSKPEELGQTATYEPSRYLLVCLRCGREIGRQKQSKVVRQPQYYRCSCGGKLRRER